MHLFYNSQINTPIHTLTEDESKHCINVLRLTKGDTLYIVNGTGGFFKAIITEPHAKRCKVEIIEEVDGFGKHNYYLHVAIAPTKNIDRFEWFVEKAVEIGIDEITPIICERSERKIVKQERTEKVAVAAMKQSLKAYLPKINECIDYNLFIKQDFNGTKCIAHCIEQEKILLKNILAPALNSLILIGPEGDFSENEIQLALANNYKAVSLGNSRLRTETAGIVACNTLAFINQ